MQKWDRVGILKAKRTLTNRRYYTDEDLALVLGLTKKVAKRKTVLYSRVSTKAQKAHLENQKRALLQYCEASLLPVDECL